LIKSRSENADRLHPFVFDDQGADVVLRQLADRGRDAVRRMDANDVVAFGAQDVGDKHVTASCDMTRCRRKLSWLPAIASGLWFSRWG
jgi:hypothetical protein